MKTSIALAMIMATLVGNSAFAISFDPDVPPPLAAVQILPSNSAQASVAPVAAATPAPAMEAATSPQAASVAAPDLRPVQILPPSAPQAVRPAALPQATRPAARPTAAAVRPVAARQVGKQDEASQVFDLCVLQENRKMGSAVRCISRAITRAEATIDSTETRILNCREIRKSEADMSEAAKIESLVDGRMFQLRLEDDTSFKTMVSSAGKIGPRKTREIELRATLKHLENVLKLANKVCDSQKFSALLAK